MARHVDRVHRQCSGQAVAHAITEIQEQRLFDRPAGRADPLAPRIGTGVQGPVASMRA